MTTKPWLNEDLHLLIVDSPNWQERYLTGPIHFDIICDKCKQILIKDTKHIPEGIELTNLYNNHQKNCL